MNNPGQEISTRLYLRRSSSGTADARSFSPSVRTIAEFLGTALVLIYFLRVSALAVLIPSISSAASIGVYSMLCLSFLLLLLNGNRRVVLPAGFTLFLAVLASCLFSPMRDQALQQGIGWLVLYSLFGPLLSGPSFSGFRAAAWVSFRILVVIVGVASAFWYLLRLPAFGTGDFTGVMSHCMLTAPLAAMACLLSILQAARTRSYRWALAGLLCVVPTLAAGSRIALISLAAGLLVVLFSVKRYRLIAFALAPVLLVYLLLAPPHDMQLDDTSSLQEMTMTLRNKGTENTRAALWQSRMDEFRAYPFLGVGVGMGQGAGAAKTGDRVNLEPGSSYLAILSMTGSVGFLAFAILAIILATRFIRNMHRIPAIDRTELLTILAFLSVHAIAEGWILAVGSILAMIYWLAVGRLMDLSAPQWKAELNR